MRYIAAYMLAQLGGKDKPTEADLKAIITSVGIDCDAERLKKVVSELNGKKMDDLIAKGEEQLATVPTGGVGVAAAAPAADAAPAAGGGKAKEEKKKEPESESDDDMGMDLFG